MMKKALVIDDVREMADSLCQMLSLMDIQAVAAYNPISALMKVKDHVPDLVFVDIHMPGIDGVEVITYLRREPLFMDVPMIVVTSDDQKETRDLSIKAGAVAVIIKPVNLDVLEKVVKGIKTYSKEK
jgi:CheY-like chemotaxis protein